MTCDPAELALREITETKRLLEAILSSDDSFNYTLAKHTVEELRLKLRGLARVQASLVKEQARAAAGIPGTPSHG
jgi:hypothetical protein